MWFLCFLRSQEKNRFIYCLSTIFLCWAAAGFGLQWTYSRKLRNSFLHRFRFPIFLRFWFWADFSIIDRFLWFNCCHRCGFFRHLQLICRKNLCSKWFNQSHFSEMNVSMGRNPYTFYAWQTRKKETKNHSDFSLSIEMAQSNKAEKPETKFDSTNFRAECMWIEQNNLILCLFFSFINWALRSCRITVVCCWLFYFVFRFDDFSGPTTYKNLLHLINKNDFPHIYERGVCYDLCHTLTRRRRHSVCISEFHSKQQQYVDKPTDPEMNE